MFKKVLKHVHVVAILALLCSSLAQADARPGRKIIYDIAPEHLLTTLLVSLGGMIYVNGLAPAPAWAKYAEQAFVTSFGGVFILNKAYGEVNPTESLTNMPSSGSTNGLEAANPRARADLQALAGDASSFLADGVKSGALQNFLLRWRSQAGSLGLSENLHEEQIAQSVLAAEMLLSEQ